MDSLINSKNVLDELAKIGVGRVTGNGVSSTSQQGTAEIERVNLKSLANILSTVQEGLSQVEDRVVILKEAVSDLQKLLRNVVQDVDLNDHEDELLNREEEEDEI